MNNFQINAIIQKNTMQTSYIGCFPENKMPLYQINGYMIINSNSNTDSIGHWLLFYGLKGNILFFDSFGKSPEFYGNNIELYAKMYKAKTINNIQLQSNTSYVCGCYVLYFAYYLFTGRPINLILNKFSKTNRIKNDSLVEDFTMYLGKSVYNCKPGLCPTKMFKTKCRENCTCNQFIYKNM